MKRFNLEQNFYAIEHKLKELEHLYRSINDRLDHIEQLLKYPIITVDVGGPHEQFD